MTGGVVVGQLACRCAAANHFPVSSHVCQRASIRGPLACHQASSIAKAVVKFAGAVGKYGVSNPRSFVVGDRKEVEEMEVSKVSPMPVNLLALLTKDEVLDMLAYVLSGGEAEHELFKR